MKKIKAFYLIVVLTISVLLISVVNVGAVSEDARRHLTRGQAAAEMAKTNSDFEEALSEFRKAIELAPEWPDAYYQLGVLQDKLGKYDDAYNNLKRCLQLAPKASNARQVQELIYKIEYKRDKANQKKVIIDALTGPAAITKKGGSPGGICVVKNFIQEGKDIKANIWCMVSAYNQTVPVEFDGSVLKFKYFYYGCPNMPTSYKSYPCPWEVSVVAEVIATSPLRLKIKEDWNRQFNGDYRQSYEGEWEFKQE